MSIVRVEWLIAAVIFSVSSIFLYYQAANKVHAHCDIDSRAYLERGTLFAASNIFVTPEKPEQPYYALGYPLLIGLLYKLCGYHIAIIIIFQVLVALLSCALMMRLARQLFGLVAQRFVSILFACNLGYLVFAQFVLTDLILSFFLLMFFERLITFFYRSDRNKYLAQAGGALGASIIIKPAALYFVALVGVLIVAIAGTWIQRLCRVTLFLLCFYIPVVGYMSYNKIAFNNFALGTLDRVNLYYWFYPNVLAQQYATTADHERLRLLKLSNGVHDHDVIAPFFWRDFWGSPFLFARVWLLNMSKTIFGLYATNLKVLVEPAVYGGSISYFKKANGLCEKLWNYIRAGVTKSWVLYAAVVEVMYSFGRYALGMGALCLLYLKRRWWELSVFILFLAYFSLITGHDGCARFRMMFEFVLVTLAAGGGAAWYNRTMKVLQ